ncbi:hypothetical protein ACH4S9_01330 [Streptomyces sp. NPDC021225]|uniref:hypothetical protein n=1 Tax=Streptomyces sp. NPDC021225 TaxID=3365121 RepID=UPI0037A4CCA2
MPAANNSSARMNAFISLAFGAVILATAQTAPGVGWDRVLASPEVGWDLVGAHRPDVGWDSAPANGPGAGRDRRPADKSDVGWD